MTRAPALCIYHQNCLDGRCAAAVVRRREPGAELRAVRPGAMVTEAVFAKRVYIVDVALDEAAMRRIAAEASEVIWLDHHESSVPLRQALGWGEIDQAECGATLAWRHCFAPEPMPPVLAYVRDKDLWRWELPDSRAICAGLDATVTDTNLDRIFDLDLEAMAAAGEPILAVISNEVGRVVARGVEVSEPYGLRGVRALAVNNLQYINEVGERITSPVEDGGLGLDLSICFALRRDGRWIHSLRSSTVDCERIASNRGGGGHKQAASYVGDRPFPLSDDCLDWPVS
jgi:oligoribonuclease NrnB/cAMP/cGMP phosphodiesterase (DHH superfamily)